MPGGNSNPSYTNDHFIDRYLERLQKNDASGHTGQAISEIVARARQIREDSLFLNRLSGVVDGHQDDFPDGAFDELFYALRRTIPEFPTEFDGQADMNYRKPKEPSLPYQPDEVDRGHEDVGSFYWRNRGCPDTMYPPKI